MQEIEFTSSDSIQADEYALGVPTVYKTTSIPTVSSLVKSEFPAFVSEDHPKFVEFIESYYEWLESHRNVLHNSHVIKHEQDIDTSTEIFTEQFFKEFLTDIPRDIVADKAQLLKHIKQFYRARGTEKSYKLFFRILYNIGVEFYYPRTDVLRVSDGKWIQNKALRVTLLQGNILNLRSNRIRGRTNNSLAFVEKIFSVQEESYSGYELMLNRSSITGEFASDEIIESEDGSVVARIQPIPTTVKIIQGGSGFKLNDTFNIGRTPGAGAQIRVTNVSSTGAIQKMSVVKYGIGYTTNTNLENITLSPSDIAIQTQPAVVSVQLGALANYPGYYVNEDGQLSTSKYIHDGLFYQQFSYVTYVNESLSRYGNILKRLLHPAGLKLFGGFRSQNHLATKLKAPTNTFNLIQERKHFPVTPPFEYPEDVFFDKDGNKKTYRHFSPPINARARLQTEMFVKNNIRKDATSYPLGPTYHSLTRHKFNYKPFVKYDANKELINQTVDSFGKETGYFGNRNELKDQRAITPVSVFGDRGLTPKILETQLRNSTNILADAVIYSRPALNENETLALSIFSEEDFGLAKVV